jgi:uncharacterized membrane protein
MRGLYLASVWLHVLAAMTWIGGMVVFVVAVMPYFRVRPGAEKSAFLDWFGPRFRATAWVCFAVLAVTGTFNLWARGVRINDLVRSEWWSTGFGRAFGVKLLLVLIAMAITVSHERTTPARARLLGRALVVVGVAIVGAAIALVRAL